MIVGSFARWYIYLPLARICTVAAIQWQKRLYAEFSLHVVIWSIGDYPGPQAWIFRISSFGFKGHQDTFPLTGNRFAKAYHGKLVDRGPSVLVLSKHQDIVHDSDDRPWLVTGGRFRVNRRTVNRRTTLQRCPQSFKIILFCDGLFRNRRMRKRFDLFYRRSILQPRYDFSFP